jgi:hypothetical protein
LDLVRDAGVRVHRRAGYLGDVKYFDRELVVDDEDGEYARATWTRKRTSSRPSTRPRRTAMSKAETTATTTVAHRGIR